MFTIEQDWTRFIAAIYDDPSKLSEFQYTEMRKAFYGGYHCMLQNAVAIGQPEVTEDEGIKFLDQRVKEMERERIKWRDKGLSKVRKQMFLRGEI